MYSVVGVPGHLGWRDRRVQDKKLRPPGDYVSGRPGATYLKSETVKERLRLSVILLG